MPLPVAWVGRLWGDSLPTSPHIKNSGAGIVCTSGEVSEKRELFYSTAKIVYIWSFGQHELE